MIPAQHRSVLPAWEDYKPRLSSLPKEPEKHQLKVSPFEPPLFEPTMPFMAPALVQVPDWVDDWKVRALSAPQGAAVCLVLHGSHPSLGPQDVADPEFSEPPELEVPDFEPPDPSAVERPEMPRPPLKLRDVAPEYGEDWTGLRPFQWEEGQWEPLEKKLVQEYKLPPKRLTAPPVLEEV